jgi:hypothetical protein
MGQNCKQTLKIIGYQRKPSAMLENLIKKYRKDDVKGIVYKLSYAGKFLVIKGKTLAGSLIIISNTYNQFNADNKRFNGHLYVHLYNYFNENKGGRFRIKTLAKLNRKTDHYKLLKREQMELDKNRFNPLCLNNSIEAYVPLYNDLTGKYGWIPRTDVMNFNKWLISKQRKSYVKRYSKIPTPKPAKSGL